MNIEECEKLFARAITSKSEAEFYYLIEPLFNEYDILSLELTRGKTYWRARIIGDNLYPNLRDLDYPKPEIANLNRLNDKGVPFFYISQDMETALAEVNPNNGQLVQLAGFKVKANAPVILAVIGEISNVQKNGYMHCIGRDPDKSISKVINQLPRNEALKKIYIDRFFAHVLNDPKASSNGYRYSRTLAQAILTKNHAEGIVYPSVKDRGGFNLGIRAEPSDKCFHNVSCVIAKVHAKRKFGMIDFEIINSAINLDENNNFVWPENYIPESLSQYNMTKEELDEVTSDPSRKVYSYGTRNHSQDN